MKCPLEWELRIWGNASSRGDRSRPKGADDEVSRSDLEGRSGQAEAAEILGITERQLRRMRQRYDEHGYDGLDDYRRRRPSPKRVPMKAVEPVRHLYRNRYYDFNVRHFHEMLVEHGIGLSYTWVKLLQSAGLVKPQSLRGAHRKRPRRPKRGMLLNIDASRHAWFRHIGSYVGLASQADMARLVPPADPHAIGAAHFSASLAILR
jgi:transposase